MPAAPLLSALAKGRGIATATLPDLPYDYDALSPVIAPEIMELHHKKHHQAYVTNLNKALEQYAEADHKNDLQALIALQPAIKFNGGGARACSPPPPPPPPWPPALVRPGSLLLLAAPQLSSSSASAPQVTSTTRCFGRC